ncbi:chaperone NapD [Rhodobacter sp. CZR27]|uniref:chaperone NapD n=1 Tax=Rhodobacter sp. CZR27 TaxID=2033869 RepID=UPI000BBF0BC5|nr:chaperone NapD [Rhodobacter sp. CZR27]
MAEPMLHISSAVLRVVPGREDAVTREVEAMGAEVALAGTGRLVVLMEAPSGGAIGDLLTRMTLIEGVHAACMVYEQAEPLRTLGEEA